MNEYLKEMLQLEKQALEDQRLAKEDGYWSESLAAEWEQVMARIRRNIEQARQGGRSV